MKNTKIVFIFSFFVTFLLFVLFPTLTPVYTFVINDLPSSPKITETQTNFEDHNIWWWKIRKELLKPNTTLLVKKGSDIQNSVQFVKKILFKRAFSDAYLAKDGAERITIFQKQLNGDKELTNLFVQLMWSGINTVAVDKLGSQLVASETTYPHKSFDFLKHKTPASIQTLQQKISERWENDESPPERLLAFPKLGEGKQFSWSSDYKHLIIPKTPSSCINENDGNILYLDLNFGKQCLGFSKKTAKNNFYNFSWWKNSFRSKTNILDPKEQNTKSITNSYWWFYANYKNIRLNSGDYLVSIFFVNFLVEALRDQFSKSDENFSNWKIDFTKLTGKSKQQLLNLLDGEGNLRSGIQENILEHIQKRWGKPIFLNNTLLEKMKILGIQQVFDPSLRRDYDSSYLKNYDVVLSDAIVKTINFQLDSYKTSIQSTLEGFANTKIKKIVIKGTPYQVDLLLQDANLELAGSELSLEVQKQFLPLVRTKITSQVLEGALLEAYHLTIVNNLNVLRDQNVAQVTINGKTYSLVELGKPVNKNKAVAILTTHAKTELATLAKNAISKTQLDTALTTILTTREAITKEAEATILQDLEKKQNQKKLIIGLSVGGGVFTLSALGGFLYWFFKIKK